MDELAGQESPALIDLVSLVFAVPTPRTVPSADRAHPDSSVTVNAADRTTLAKAIPATLVSPAKIWKTLPITGVEPVRLVQPETELSAVT